MRDAGRFLHELFYDSDTLFAAWSAAAHQSWAARGMSSVLLDVLFQLAAAAAVAVFFVLNALFIIYFERKLAARMQVRRGPNRVGPLGLLQTRARIRATWAPIPRR